MNHFGKGLREDKFHCALKGINVMLMRCDWGRSNDYTVFVVLDSTTHAMVALSLTSQVVRFY
jgi:hypothetical protein